MSEVEESVYLASNLSTRPTREMTREMHLLALYFMLLANHLAKCTLLLNG